MSEDVYTQIVQKIIEQQEAIIGPVAIEQAKHVSNISVDWPKHNVKISGNGQVAIDDLVHQYEHLFGRLSVEVCKEATSTLVAQLPPAKQPKTLKA
jgi:hypothetical protein